MHPRMIWAIVRKDFLDIWLNKSTLGGLVGPIILALLWLLISRLVGGQQTSLLIYNPGNSSLAQVVERAYPSANIVEAGSATEVQAAFGPNGAKVKSSYTVGLVLPANFDASLQAGTTPTLSLFINRDSINGQTQALLQTAITNYARAIANPQPPVKIDTIVINPPSTENAGVILEQVYTPMALVISLVVGTTFIPILLIEEKEKKTLRMLLVTPASFSDILAGKMLVVLVFQLAITCVVVAILGGFSNNVPLILLFILLGAIFSLSLGLLFGSVFNSVQSRSTISGFISFVLVVSGIFVGPQLGQVLGNGLVAHIVRLIPTYYLADGVVNASQNLGSVGSNLLDMGVLLAYSVVLMGISAWMLRRQSAILALI